MGISQRDYAGSKRYARETSLTERTENENESRREYERWLQNISAGVGTQVTIFIDIII